MAYNVKLRKELIEDPLLRGYSSMTVGEIEEDGNEKRYLEDRDTITNSDLLGALVVADFVALPSAQRTVFQSILAVPTYNIKDPQIRALFAVLFAGTATGTNILALQQHMQSRFEVLGVPGDSYSIMQALEG